MKRRTFIAGIGASTAKAFTAVSRDPGGLGGIARRIKVTGASTMGSMTAYWSTRTRLEYLDANHFVNQMAVMSQIAGSSCWPTSSRSRSDASG